MLTINKSKVSSKGQIVIPKSLREHFKEGDEIIFIEEGNRVILKNIKDFGENFKEDFEFGKRTEKILNNFERNPKNFNSLSFDDFIEHLEKQI